jgi:hypothetical protein
MSDGKAPQGSYFLILIQDQYRQNIRRKIKFKMLSSFSNTAIKLEASRAWRPLVEHEKAMPIDASQALPCRPVASVRYASYHSAPDFTTTGRSE